MKTWTSFQEKKLVDLCGFSQSRNRAPCIRSNYGLCVLSETSKVIGKGKENGKGEALAETTKKKKKENAPAGNQTCDPRQTSKLSKLHFPFSILLPFLFLSLSLWTFAFKALLRFYPTDKLTTVVCVRGGGGNVAMSVHKKNSFRIIQGFASVPCMVFVNLFQVFKVRFCTDTENKKDVTSSFVASKHLKQPHGNALVLHENISVR